MPKAICDYVDSLPHAGEERVLEERLTMGFTYRVPMADGMSNRCLVGAGEDFQTQEDFAVKSCLLSAEQVTKLMMVGCSFDFWATRIGVGEAGAQIRQRILDNRLARQAQFAEAVTV